MSGSNLDKSIGTCYFDTHKVSGSNYISCGNTALALDSWCCNAGDFCLSSNACFHNVTGTTYLAGCTDPKYNAPTCPFKGNFRDQQIVGLQRCDNIRKADTWAGCDGPRGPEIEYGSPCSCSDDSILFTAGKQLTQIASLPTSSGGIISYASGQEPTLTTGGNIAPTTSTGMSGDGAITAAPSITDAVSTSTPEAEAATKKGLPIGGKAGIGVGVSVGVILVMVFFAIFLRRRKRKKEILEHGDQPEREVQLPLSDQRREVPAESPVWLGFKAELPADESFTARTRTSTAQESPAHLKFRDYDPRSCPRVIDT